MAAEVSLLLPARHAWRWWLFQAGVFASVRLLCATTAHDLRLSCNLAGAPTSLLTPQRALVQTSIDVTIVLMFQAVAFAVGALARLEQRRRAELAVAHGELLATRQLIGETATVQERIRVARDLHDSVGHQLTAMKLHLDLALRQSDAIEPLHEASRLAQALLAEVRAVVGAERGATTSPR